METADFETADYDKPTIVPSDEMSIFSAFGVADNPGISIMLPAIATIKPEPVLSSMSRT